MMTRETYWNIVDNYELHKALEEVERIPYCVNRSGDHYKYLLKSIERKWGVTL